MAQALLIIAVFSFYNYDIHVSFPTGVSLNPEYMHIQMSSLAPTTVDTLTYFDAEIYLSLAWLFSSYRSNYLSLRVCAYWIICPIPVCSCDIAIHKTVTLTFSTEIQICTIVNVLSTYLQNL